MGNGISQGLRGWGSSDVWGFLEEGGKRRLVYNKGQGEMPDGLYAEIVCVFMSVCMGRSEGWWETHV